MPRIRTLTLAAALLFAGLRAQAIAPAAPMVVGYVFSQETLLQPGQIDAHGLSRINYAFANIQDGRMVNGFAADASNLAFLTGLRKENPSLTVLVSVGGWLWSTNFSDVSLTAQSRALFIQSAMEFLRRYDLDGLDIDWEYPGLAGSGHPFRAEDGSNFTLLLKELRKQFDRETAKTHRRLYLTIAAGASNDYLAYTEMRQSQKYLDTVNLMAYDYVEPGSDPLTGHHAPLFTDRPLGEEHRQQKGGWLSLFGGGRARQEAPPPLRDYRTDPTPVLQARAAAVAAQQSAQPQIEEQADSAEDLEIPSFLRRLAN